jgi:methyl-accepting chemotaxis protein
MLVFAALSTSLVGSSYFALERLRSDIAATTYLGKGRVAYQILYLFGQRGAAAPEERPEIAGRIRELMGWQEKMLTTLADGDPALGITPENDPVLLADLREAQTVWENEVRPVLEQALDSLQLSPAEMAEVEELVRNYAVRIDNNLEARAQASSERLDRGQMLHLAFSAAAILILVGVLWLVRSMTKRTRALAHVARRISSGELGLVAPDGGGDEIAYLGASFNTMTFELAGRIEREREDRKKLEELLSTVAETARLLSATAAEILAATTQQAAGMREQSSAVAETVTSVDEVLQTADQAAKRAQAVANVSETAVGVSGAGRQAVEETMAAMGAAKEKTETIADDILRLAENSQAIAEIVSAVTEIADQTNLLALNASIEAARAGEHGRGFSVVASEIRDLAEQSKRATEKVRRILGDIQNATNTSVLATEDGTKSVDLALARVTEAGERIRELEMIITEAARSAGQIAASAGQQSTGMRQIHQAMNHINQAASQNLSATRQSEQAARELNELGGRLKQMLAGYGR